MKIASTKFRVTRYFNTLVVAVIFISGTIFNSSANELLLNRSFETPVAPLSGNNFYETLPDWVSVPNPVVALEVNLVRPFAGYPPAGPAVTPPSGGDQYFDFRGTAGTLFQDVVIPTSGVVTIAAWFSARDTPRDVSGLTIRLRNSAGTVVATGSTSFSSTEPIGIWREVRIENTAVPAGTYTFEADLPNPANIDLASVDFTPTGIAILKSATGITDLDGNGPDQGDILNYAVSVRNTGSAALTNVQVSDIGATVNGGPIAVLNAGQTDTTTFTIAQTLTQNDFDVGQALNQAVASASQPGGSLITDQSDPLSFSGNAETLTALPTTRSMVMDKTADTVGPLSAGMTVNYSYKVTNNGNVTIRDVIVVDAHNGSGTLPVPDDEVLITDVLPSADSSDLDSTDQIWSVLAPGDTVEFTAPYTVMQSDIDNLQP